MKTKKHSEELSILKIFWIMIAAIVTIITFSSCGKGKEVTGVESEPYETVDIMPGFPGGNSALLKYLGDNTSYPDSAKKKLIQGKVIVRFCVTSKGEIDRVSIAKGASPELDAEAIRVVKTLPSFEPGQKGGKPVAVWYTVPINFTLR